MVKPTPMPGHVRQRRMWCKRFANRNFSEEANKHKDHLSENELIKFKNNCVFKTNQECITEKRMAFCREVSWKSCIDQLIEAKEREGHISYEELHMYFYCRDKRFKECMIKEALYVRH